MSTALTSPYTYVILLLIAGYFFRKKEKTERILLTSAVGLLIFFTLPSTFTVAIGMWCKGFESGYSSNVPDGKSYTYGVVLGGFGTWDQKRERPEFGENADRLFEGIRLYKEKKINKLVLASDGSNRTAPDGKWTEGNPLMMREYICNLGVQSKDLIFENTALTTHENATTIKQLLHLTPTNHTKDDILLITSALHMRRAVLAFEQEEINVTPYTTDCSFEGQLVISSWIPSLRTGHNWQSLIHEIIGFYVYKIRW